MKQEPDHKDILEQIRQSLPDEVPDMLNQKMKSMLAGFRHDLAAHPILNIGSDARSLRWRWSLALAPAWGRLAMMAGFGVACLAVVLAVLLVDRTPSWAEVEKKFGNIAFCTVSVYHRYDVFGRPTFAQYWFGRDGRARIHSGKSVVFISPDAPKQVFDLKTRGKGYPDIGVKGFLRTYERARESGTPTLISIIEALAGEAIVNTTDLMISDAQVARDLVVFDARSRDTLWRVRVWALRESMLPLRIIKWHQTNGRHIELIFNYSRERRPEFFDAGAFAAELEDPSTDRRRLMEMLFQFPGGEGVSGVGE